MQLWIMSFVESGVLESKEESEAIYMRVMAISMIALAIVGPIFGYISDKTDSRVLIPLSFLLRAICAISFRFIDNPAEWPAMVLCVAISVISTIQFISVEVLFLRNMKSHIRGTLVGMSNFFGSVGLTVFVLIGGKLFDNIAPWAPFWYVGFIDVLILIFSMVFIGLGLLSRTD